MQRPLAISVVCALCCAGRVAHAESEQQRELRTNEAETSEPLTDQPLKAAMQNLFLQEDVFPQQRYQVQTGLRLHASDLNAQAGLEMSAGAELGFADSWTVSARVPLAFLPKDERGLGNPELSLLYSAWVSAHEDLRLTANISTVLPSISATGDRAFAHDLSAIGYARWAPLHFQVVLTLDLSYGSDVAPSPRVRPEGSVAAILKLEQIAFVWEAALLQEFSERSYLTALGMFWYPGSFEVGLSCVLDASNTPLTIGAMSVVSYAFDPPS